MSAWPAPITESAFSGVRTWLSHCTLANRTTCFSAAAASTPSLSANWNVGMISPKLK